MEDSRKVRKEQTLSEETQWEKAAKTRMGKYLTRMEADFIFKSISPSGICTVMDVGAEAGRFSSLSQEKNATKIGIDIDSCGLRRLKLKNKGVDVIQADARAIPVKDGVFDAVFMIEVLDYIDELDEALSECCRILKSDAPLILSFGNRSSLKSKLRELRGKSYRHSYKKVMCALSKAGFKAMKKMGYSWLPLGRTSESRFVPFLAGIEKVLALRRLPSLSPWVIVYSVKSDKPF